MGSKDTNSRLVSAQGLYGSIALAVSISGICWAQKPELVVQIGHSGPVNSVAIGSDDKTLASGSTDKTIKLWNIDKGTELRTLRGHAGEVSSVEFSPDGKTLASGSTDRTIKLWDVSSGTELLTLKGHSGAINSVAISARGRLASGSTDKTIKLWNMAQGTELCTLRGHVGEISSVAFSPDGRTLASGSTDKTIKLWDVTSCTELFTLKGHTDYVLSVVFSPDGKTLASGSADETIKLWDVMNGSDLLTLRSHAGLVRSVVFGPDGKTLASGGGTAGIELWDVLDGRDARILKGHVGSVLSLAFNSHGGMLVSSSMDRTIKLWKITDGTELRTLEGHNNWIKSIAFSADGRTLASGGWDNAIKLWDMRSGKPMMLQGHVGFDLSVAFGPDGKTLASGGDDNTIKLWDLQSGTERLTLQGHAGYVLSVTFSPDGKTLASGSADKTIKLWNVANGVAIRTLQAAHEVSSVAFSPDGKTLASAADNVKLWDMTGATEPRTLKSRSEDIRSIAFSPDGKIVAGGNANGEIELWDVADHGGPRVFKGHSGIVLSVAFSPDGKTLASGSGGNTIKLWDVMTGTERRTLPGHAGFVGSVAFSPDGRTLISAGWDAKLKVWQVSTGNELLSLVALDENDWAVVTPDGRFDANNLESIRGLQWVMPDDPLTPLPVEIFMRPYFEPRLLSRLLANDDFREVLPLADLNRVQPTVTITKVTNDGPDSAAVTIEVENVAHRYEREKNPVVESGAKDLRLFRDGQLIGYRDGDLLGQKRNAAGCEPIEGGARKCRAVFEHIRLPQQKDVKDVEFSAYAFNTSDVKSETFRLLFKFTPELPAKKGRVYLITMGVSKYENPDWNLEFAANDAHLIDDTVAAKLRATGDYSEVVSVMLTSEERVVNGQRELVKSATKENFTKVMQLLAGERLPNSETREIPNAQQIEKATPEDVVLIFYSNHGYRDEERFYLFPYDTGPGQGRDPEAVLPHSISSDDLYRWLRDIDAGDMVLVVDACHAAAVTGKEFKPGPMGSRGMGQLAYDKGMRILAATQPDTTAAEVDNINQKRKIQHGLLTYALVQDGLIDRRADINGDKLILLSEWLQYGVTDVPRLYAEAARSQTASADQATTAPSQQRGPNQVRFISRGDGDTSVQQPYLFDFAEKTRRKRNLAVARTR